MKSCCEKSSKHQESISSTLGADQKESCCAGSARTRAPQAQLGFWEVTLSPEMVQERAPVLGSSKVWLDRLLWDTSTEQQGLCIWGLFSGMERALDTVPADRPGSWRANLL